MRFFTNHSAAPAATDTMPFGGLGFDAGDIQAVARMMTPENPRRHRDNPGIILPPPKCTGPTGYGLLVSLGREIRGR